MRTVLMGDIFIFQPFLGSISCNLLHRGQVCCSGALQLQNIFCRRFFRAGSAAADVTTRRKERAGWSQTAGKTLNGIHVDQCPKVGRTHAHGGGGQNASRKAGTPSLEGDFLETCRQVLC